MGSLDIIITALIILAIILVIFAKVSGQTITELLSDLKEFIQDLLEGGKDKASDITTQVYD